MASHPAHPGAFDTSGVTKHTIYDIARIAGVSGKTVSRVLNKEASVKAKTRDRVLGIIEQLGYQPHYGARSLRGQQRDCVGVVLSAPMGEVPVSHQQIHWLFFELERVCAPRGKFVCFDLNPYYEGRKDGDYARALWQQRCSGCVVYGALPVDDKTIARIHYSGYPYLALNRQDNLPELCFASVDYDMAAYLSASRLIRAGHTQIGMLQAFPEYQAGKERVRGYVRAMEEAGLSVDLSLIRPVSFAGNDITSGAQYLLQERAVTAIVDCSMLEDPARLREGARRAGRIAGGDFDVVDWTYSPDAIVLPEACAHVCVPLRETTTAGIESLIRWFDKEIEGPFQILRQPTLFEAGTTESFTQAIPLFDTLS